jgi:hypothetical protein
MNVVLTAPSPGNNTPSFPFAGAIFPGFFIPLLLKSRLPQGHRLRLRLKIEIGRREAFRSAEQSSNDERSAPDLQTSRSSGK